MVYFHFWFHKLFLQKQPFASDLQSTCSEDREHIYVMEISFTEVGDCNFIIKGLHIRGSFQWILIIFFIFLQNTYRRMVLLLLGFYEILQVFWKHLQYFYFTSTVGLAEAIMIWLTKKMNTFSYQSRCFVN